VLSVITVTKIQQMTNAKPARAAARKSKISSTSADVQLDIPEPLTTRLNRFRKVDFVPDQPVVAGRLTRMVGLTIEVVGINTPIGRNCIVRNRDGREIEAEVVGFDNGTTFLMPIQRVEGLEPGATVVPVDRRSSLIMGDHLCGRVVNGIGQPLDGLGDFDSVSRSEFKIKAINPMQRHPIEEPLDVGIRW